VDTAKLFFSCCSPKRVPTKQKEEKGNKLKRVDRNRKRKREALESGPEGAFFFLFSRNLAPRHGRK
jgi:hypothetical protein